MESLAHWREQGHYFTHEGHKIFYRLEGEGPNLLCLHGFPTASWDWSPLWPELTRHFRVLAPDLLGFGYSDKPRGYRYSLFKQTDLVESLCLSLDMGSVAILSHDYSDTIVQELSARTIESKERLSVRRAVLLNGGILYGSYRPRPIQKLLLSPLGRLIGPMMSEGRFRKSFVQIFGRHTRPSDAALKDWWQLIAHNAGTRVVHDVIQYQRERKVFQDRWRNALRDAPFPLKLIFGDVDPISGRSIALEYEGLTGDSVTLLEDIGHYPQTESPDRVLEEALPFLLDT